MLTQADKKIAQNFKNRIGKVVPIIDFKIFGSSARGEATDESDLDVYIEVEDITFNERQKIWEIAFDVGFEVNRIISTFVATRDQLKNGAVGANPIIFRIKEEGIQI